MLTRERVTGTVTRWWPARGYGFIRLDEPPHWSVYCHFACLTLAGKARGRGDLAPGMRVELELVEGPRGPQAIEVRELERAPA